MGMGFIITMWDSYRNTGLLINTGIYMNRYYDIDNPTFDLQK